MEGKGREGKGREGKNTVWRHDFRSSGDWQPGRDISIKDVIQAPQHHHISIQVKNLVKFIVKPPHVNLVKGRTRAGEILGALCLRGQPNIVLNRSYFPSMFLKPPRHLSTDPVPHHKSLPKGLPFKCQA